MEKLAVSGEWIAKRTLNGLASRTPGTAKGDKALSQLQNIKSMTTPQQVAEGKAAITNSPAMQKQINQLP